MGDNIIKVQNLTKIYPIFNNKSDRLKEAFSLTRKKYHRDFYALKDISFEVNKGETIGIIGQNGSGKSTLLKILSGVLTQTSGEMEINGKIAALLELGAGFNPDMTGLENIRLNGTIMGFSKAEIDSKIDRIIEFADIGQFIYQPVKLYSSGMFVRLAFAVAINVEPEILIVDEALAVGDIRFQQKCFREIERFKSSGTILMVSHDLTAIAKFCDRALWIDGGKIQYFGDTKTAIEKYNSHIINMLDQKLEFVETKPNKPDKPKIKRDLKPIPRGLEISGNGDVSIVAAGLFDENNSITDIVYPDKLYTFAVKVKFHKKIKDIIFGFLVKNRLGMEIFGLNTDMMGINIDPETDICEYGCSFTMPKLISGDYTISAAIASGTSATHTQHCWVHDIYLMKVLSNDSGKSGVIFIDDAKFECL